MTDDAMMLEALEGRAKRREDRRAFFRNMGLAAAVAGGTAVATHAAQAATGPTDADILNFALNLEYLEANFYHQAVYGSPLPDNMTDGTGTRGAATGGRQVKFSDNMVQLMAREIAMDEMAHVQFLRGALGKSAVAQPAIDISASPNGAFSKAAQAAGLGATFDPYASDENFLLAAFIFEDVGVTAYKGASPLISNATYLEAAAGILAVEGYHAAMLRTTLYSKGMMDPSSMLIGATEKISNARDSLDGPDDDDQGVADSTNSMGERVSNLVPADNSTGLIYSRSYGQVLNVVYLNNMAVSKGGFFPDGVNGTLAMSASH